MVSWVCISSCVDFSVFVTVTLQNVCGGGLLCVRDSSSGSDGEEIYGSSSGKGCVSSREGGIGDGSNRGRGDVSGGSLHYTSRGLLSAFSDTRVER